MAEKYYAEEDKVRRIGNTICTYKGMPVAVMGRTQWRDRPLGEEDVYVSKTLARGNNMYDPASWDVVKYTSPDFSDRTFPLGYMNYGGQAYYLSRSPVQQQSQGLTRGVINSIPAVQNLPIFSQEMEDCILGKYPTLSECLSTLGKGYSTKSMAFSRDFAVAKIGRAWFILSYKGREIGIKATNENNFSVWKHRDNKIITRLLDEQGVPYVIKDDC